MRKETIMLYAILLLLVLLQGTGGATTFYAQPGGTNTSCSTNPTTPISGAVRGAGCLASGDTLILKDGDYNEFLADVVPSGVASSYTTVKAEHPRGARLYGRDPANSTKAVVRIGPNNRRFIQIEGLVLDGQNTDGAIVQLLNAPTCTINLDCTFPGDHFTNLDCLQDVRIVNNEIKNTAAGRNVNSPWVGIGTGGGQYRLTLQDNHIHHIGTGFSADDLAWDYAIYFSNATDSVIEGNEIDHISGYAIQMYCSCGVCDRITVRNNYFHDNQQSILLACGGHDNLIYNNIFARMGLMNAKNRGGMVFGPSCSGTQSNGNQIYNNTLVYNVTDTTTTDLTACIGLNAGGGMFNNIVRNNLCWGGTPDDHLWNNTSGQTTNTLDHNSCSGVVGYGSCGGIPYGGDPQFVRTIPNSDLTAAGIVKEDFQLGPNSPYRDLGMNTTSVVATDMGGNPRLLGPAQDLGAWESGGTPTPPLPQQLYLYWRLDETSGVTAADSAPHDPPLHDGTLTGTPTPTHVGGRVGPRGLAVTGAGERVATTTELIWPANTAVTLAFWVLTPGGPTGGPSLGMPSTSPNLFGVCMPCPPEGGAQRSYVYWQYGNFTGAGTTGSMFADFTPYLNAWTHVVLTADANGNNGAIWFNGVRVAFQGTFSRPTSSITTGFEAGRWNKAGSPFSGPGTLDDIQLYAKLLTDQEILALYRSTAGRVRHTAQGH